MRLAYADPPYPGMSHFYRDHADYAGEVDHADLVRRLKDEYDAWALHTASTTLHEVLPLCPPDVRIGAWVKTFASFKPGVNPAYAWEPVIFHGGQNDSSKTRATVADWIACPIHATERANRREAACRRGMGVQDARCERDRHTGRSLPWNGHCGANVGKFLTPDDARVTRSRSRFSSSGT